jgi:hypothetical protein
MRIGPQREMHLRVFGSDTHAVERRSLDQEQQMFIEGASQVMRTRRALLSAVGLAALAAAVHLQLHRSA